MVQFFFWGVAIYVGYFMWHLGINAAARIETRDLRSPAERRCSVNDSDHQIHEMMMYTCYLDLSGRWYTYLPLRNILLISINIWLIMVNIWLMMVNNNLVGG